MFVSCNVNIFKCSNCNDQSSCYGSLIYWTFYHDMWVNLLRDAKQTVLIKLSFNLILSFAKLDSLFDIEGKEDDKM